MKNSAKRTRQRKPKWIPIVGQFASYSGKTSPLLRGGKLVSVIAEASAQKMVVEAIGYAGRPVRFTVNASNLIQPQPSLFDL